MTNVAKAYIKADDKISVLNNESDKVIGLRAELAHLNRLMVHTTQRRETTFIVADTAWQALEKTGLTDTLNEREYTNLYSSVFVKYNEAYQSESEISYRIQSKEWALVSAIVNSRI